MDETTHNYREIKALKKEVKLLNELVKQLEENVKLLERAVLRLSTRNYIKPDTESIIKAVGKPISNEPTIPVVDD